MSYISNRGNAESGSKRGVDESRMGVDSKIEDGCEVMRNAIPSFPPQRVVNYNSNSESGSNYKKLKCEDGCEGLFGTRNDAAKLDAVHHYAEKLHHGSVMETRDDVGKLDVAQHHAEQVHRGTELIEPLRRFEAGGWNADELFFIDRVGAKGGHGVREGVERWEGGGWF
ncbi:hypothetical protein HDU98_001555 [Podochytrium sp. JEL0797]|nr:hypothetical protein HDU98_001555 [Podochytrium sp. JEL0797]